MGLRSAPIPGFGDGRLVGFPLVAVCGCWTCFSAGPTSFGLPTQPPALNNPSPLFRGRRSRSLMLAAGPSAKAHLLPGPTRIRHCTDVHGRRPLQGRPAHAGPANSAMERFGHLPIKPPWLGKDGERKTGGPTGRGGDKTVRMGRRGQWGALDVWVGLYCEWASKCDE